MELLTLALLCAALGYLLATGSFGRRFDRTTGRFRSSVGRWWDGLGHRWSAFWRRSPKGDAFRAWALSRGSDLFPADFRSWLAGLTEAEAEDFSRSLAEYSSSLGFSLKELVDGGLDHDPIMRQVFVEAIVVYSPAYRKVRKAQQEAEPAPESGDSSAAPQSAEKAPSRRKNTNGAKETAEAPATD